MDGNDVENPIKDKNITKNEETIYYQTVIPRIKKRLINRYGTRTKPIEKINEESTQTNSSLLDLPLSTTEEEKNSTTKNNNPLQHTNINS